MTNLKDKFEPIDVIALTIIAGCIISMAIKGDTAFKDVLLIITGFYFGRQTEKSKTDNK